MKLDEGLMSEKLQELAVIKDLQLHENIITQIHVFG